MKESTITIRVTPEQKDALQVKAKTIGFSVSEYVRLLIINDLGQIIPETTDVDEKFEVFGNALRDLMFKHRILSMQPRQIGATGQMDSFIGWRGSPMFHLIGFEWIGMEDKKMLK